MFPRAICKEIRERTQSEWRLHPAQARKNSPDFCLDLFERTQSKWRPQSISRRALREETTRLEFGAVCRLGSDRSGGLIKGWRRSGELLSLSVFVPSSGSTSTLPG